MNEPIRAEFLEAVAALSTPAPSSTAPPSPPSSRRSRRTAGPADARRRRERARRAAARAARAGIEPGDEVIVPAQTFVATLEAVTQAGGIPSPSTSGRSTTTSTRRLPKRRSRRAHAVLLPVHLYGQMADMQCAARRSPSAHGLAIVEDACQAHGAERDGLRAGAGGLARRVQLLPGQEPRRDGRRRRADDRRRGPRGARARAPRARPAAKYHHDLEGYTARLDTIQAIVLALKLPLLDGWNEERRARGARYSARRSRASATSCCPPSPPGATRSGTSTSCGRPTRRRSRRILRERGIATGRHYPEPVAPRAGLRAPRLRGRARSRSRRQLARECLSLPIFPGITEAQLDGRRRRVRAYFAVAD